MRSVGSPGAPRTWLSTRLCTVARITSAAAVIVSTRADEPFFRGDDPERSPRHTAVASPRCANATEMSKTLSRRGQRHASMETVARNEPLIIFHAPCVSPPATTMLISDGSKILITSSGLALKRDAYGSTPATARGRMRY